MIGAENDRVLHVWFEFSDVLCVFGGFGVLNTTKASCLESRSNSPLRGLHVDALFVGVLRID